MVPTKKQIYIINICIIVVAIIVSSLPIWIFVFPRSLIKAIIGISIIIAAITIGGLIGWLVQRKIYPEIYGTRSKQKTLISELAVTKEENQVEFELNTEDIVTFYLYNYEYSPNAGRMRRLLRRIIMFVSLLLFICAIALFIVSGQQQIIIAIALTVMAVFLLFWSLFFPLVARKALRKSITGEYSRKQNKLIGTHKLSITSDAVTDISDMGMSTTDWNAVEYIAVTEKYLFIVVHLSGPHIVPERAFKDNKEFQQFVDAAQYHYQKAKELKTD